MANPETAAVAINVLNKVIRYAVGLGVGASILQTSLYNGMQLELRLGVSELASRESLSPEPSLVARSGWR